MLAAQANTAAWFGKLKDARDLTRQAIDSAHRNDVQETAAAYQAEIALFEADSGNRQQSRTDAAAAMKLAPTRIVRPMAALALAPSGDTAAAEKLANELDKSFPPGTLVRNIGYRDPAAVALQHKDPNRAIGFLQTASAIELSRQAASRLFARRSLSHAPRRQPSGRRISKVPRPSRPREKRTMGRSGPPRSGACLCDAGRHPESPDRLSGFPGTVERRRPRYPDPARGEGGIRQAAVSVFSFNS